MGYCLIKFPLFMKLLPEKTDFISIVADVCTFFQNAGGGGL